MASVTLDDATKVYDDSQGTEIAVKELNLSFRDGEFIVLLGPSGCGKSTTLRMIAGLESVTDGHIYLNEERIDNKAPKNRDIAMVFQNYALYPHKTVRENMSYGLKKSTNLSKQEIRSRVESTAEMMGIEDLLEKQPGSLSGGQQQRVATGRAIVREPEVFLFDEPLSNLDAKLRKHMRTELARLHEELGITSIYVTHDQEEAMTLGDRIVILNDGQLQQVGTPLEVYDNPANLFVAEFVGSPGMNFFDVRLERADDGAAKLIGDEISYPISGQLATQIENNQQSSDLVLGVRPESVRIADGGEFSAEVAVVETHGSDNFIYLAVTSREFQIRARPDIIPSVGETVSCTFDEETIHVFDAETEQNLLSTPQREMDGESTQVVSSGD